ncbi:phage tail tape measure protein, partial [Jeotgalibaca porci]|uniref:phage tail tape measure protein n=2 Tax=Jeotgalibaca porci TaxID=1868793 RepID=UPI0035A083DE
MAKRVSGITVEIGGDTTKLGKALGDVNKQSRGLQSELRGVNTLLKMDPTNVVLIRQKQELLNTSIDKTKDKLNVLKGAQKEVQEQFDKGEITEEQYRDFQREIEATKIKLKDLKDESKDFGGVIGESLKVAGEKVTEFGKKTEEAGKKLAPFSAVAAAMLVGSGKAAIDFESAWAGVMKTVDGTPEQMDTIRQSILDMSGELPASAEEIAQVAENAGQLGIQTDNVLSFTKTMIDMGEATNMSADTASTSLARFANITQMSQGDFSRLGSTIVNLGNNMATTEGEIVDMSLPLVGTGMQVGLSVVEIM